MNWNEAKNFVMPFGKHKGETLDKIASTDAGLLYLDWCVGEFKEGKIKRAIEAYLSDATIGSELDKLLVER